MRAGTGFWVSESVAQQVLLAAFKNAGLPKVISKPLACLNPSFHPSWFPSTKAFLPLEVSREPGLALDKAGAVSPLL